MKSKISYKGIGDIADILLVWFNFLFGFLIIYFLIIASAPLFGGIMLPLSGFIPFAYWAGFYFTAKYFLKNMRDKIILKNYQYWFIGLYFSLLYLDFPTPINIIAFVLLFFLFLKLVKIEIESWANDLDMNDEFPNK